MPAYTSNRSSRPQLLAKKNTLQRVLPDHDSNQRQDPCVGIAATQPPVLYPRIKIARNRFHQFAQMPADQPIKVLIQLQGAELKKPQDLRPMHQGLGVSRSKSRAPVARPSGT